MMEAFHFLRPLWLLTLPLSALTAAVTYLLMERFIG